jgi:non-ribosomal peptide synthetase component F
MPELSYPEKRKLLAELLEKRNRTRKTAPLSFAQERLFFLDQLQPNSALYNLPVSFRLQTRVDVDALEKSLSEIVRRHEVLRTTFELEGTPVQVIRPAAPVKLQIDDVSSSPDRETEAQRLAAIEAQEPFNLRDGPLFRARLVRLHEQDQVLLLTMHHIVSDGWSMLVLVRELSALYQSYSRGTTASLPELPIQYSDFARWQRQTLNAEGIEQHLDYWREQLAGAPPVLELPFDRPRPAVQTFRGDMQHFTIGRGVSNQLLRLGEQEGVTVFMTLLAAFQVLLARYSGQQDVVVGTPIANRDRAELEGLIGFFVNSLVLRTRMEDDPVFVDLLKRVKQTTVAAYAHQDLPFEKLVEQLQPERELSHNPLFQVMFATDLRTDATRPTSTGPPSLLMQTNTGTSKFDLALNMSQSQTGLIGIFEYNTDLFDTSTIQRLIGIWEELLQSIAANPRERISKLNILSQQERRQLIAESHGVSFPSESLISEAIAAQAQRTPDAVAIKLGENVLSYGELDERANQVARGLRGVSVLEETIVGICMKRSIDAVVALLGILKAGAAFLLLDPDSSDDGLLRNATVFLTHIAFDRHEDEAIEVEIHPERVACVTNAFRSDEPLPVAVSQQSLASRCQDLIRRYELGPSDHVLQLADFADIGSIELILATLAAGSRLVMRGDNAWPAEEVRRVLLSEGITVVDLPVDVSLDGSLRLVIVDRLRLLRQGTFKRARIIGKYGPAEATSCASFEIEADFAGKRIPIGRPAGNSSLYVLDAHLNLVPIGVVGELYVGGNKIARGYLNNPELTATRFQPDPYSKDPGARMYRTGDLARHLANGIVEFVGSVDRVAKIRGMRLDLSEVESVLREFPGVDDAVAATYKAGDGEVRLGVHLIGDVRSRPSPKVLRRYVGEKLPAYMRPTAFTWLDELPKNHFGIDYAVLPPFLSAEEALDFVAPASALEQVMAGIWAELIGVDEVGSDDSFFELGGHSLLATQLSSRMLDVFDVMIPIQQLFETPILADFCSVVLNESSDRRRTEKIAEFMLTVADTPDGELRATL